MTLQARFKRVKAGMYKSVQQKNKGYGGLRLVVVGSLALCAKGGEDNSRHQPTGSFRKDAMKRISLHGTPHRSQAADIL